MALAQPNGNLDGSASFGGNEDASFNITSGRTASVWYGAASLRWVRLDGMSGTVTLNNATFGDVAPFTAKSGYYLLDPDGSGGSLSMTVGTDSFGLSTCVASENETYNNASAYSAWYGASSTNLVRLDNQTGTTTFSNAAFGGDPAGGVSKYGFVLVGAPSGILTPYEVNLTTEGTDTWAVFNSGTSGVANDRKASSDSDNKISDLGTNISTGTTYLAARTATDLIKSIWTNGTTNASSNTLGMVGNTYNQVDNREWKIGAAQNFIADTTERTAKLYLVAKGSMRISAVLSDGSAPAVVQTYKTNAATTALSNEAAYIRTLVIVSITYKAASAGQTLRVQATAAENGNSDNRSEVYLQSSTLTVNSSDTNIDCAIGTATASGLSATVDKQQNITCAIGTATASGLSAAIDQQQNITCAIGSATASGLSATIDQQQNITCSIGTAVASGLSATLGGDTTISGNIGTVDASGLSATIDQQQNITCSIGTATANGLSATVDNSTDISCSIGTAVASGLSGTVEGTTEINCTIGTAVASGLSASLGGDTTITCAIGATNASGLTLTIDQQQNITCSIGVAVASGLEVSFNAEGRIKQAIKEAYASAPAGTIVIHTLEFRHPNFRDQSGQPTAIRVVLGHQNLEARLEEDAPQNAGEYVVFIPMAFDLELPNIEHLAVPEITIAIDNVSRDIEDNLTLAAASPYKVEVTYRPYLNTDLTQPQWNPPPSYTIISAEADDFRVTARASFGNAANVLTPREVYTSDRFPGLQR